MTKRCSCGAFLSPANVVCRNCSINKTTKRFRCHQTPRETTKDNHCIVETIENSSDEEIIAENDELDCIVIVEKESHDENREHEMKTRGTTDDNSGIGTFSHSNSNAAQMKEAEICANCRRCVPENPEDTAPYTLEIKMIDPEPWKQRAKRKKFSFVTHSSLLGSIALCKQCRIHLSEKGTKKKMFGLLLYLVF